MQTGNHGKGALSKQARLEDEEHDLVKTERMLQHYLWVKFFWKQRMDVETA